MHLILNTHRTCTAACQGIMLLQACCVCVPLRAFMLPVSTAASSVIHRWVHEVKQSSEWCLSAGHARCAMFKKQEGASVAPDPMCVCSHTESSFQLQHDVICFCFAVLTFQIEDLHHVITTGDTDTFVIDFEYGSSGSKTNKQEVISSLPTMQVRQKPQLECWMSVVGTQTHMCPLYYHALYVMPLPCCCTTGGLSVHCGCACPSTATACQWHDC